ncbi:protein JTB isoform X3 [Cherax quadricarinatus]|uniref:protein JTB isoform X3 n=1 Tax=Cherax quadricarinatus TaxID=27406 RepID=UPI00387E56D8
MNMYYYRLTWVALVIESYVLAPALEDPEELISLIKSRDLCWINEEYDPLDDCQKCSYAERAFIVPALCQLTGYRQKVQCYFSGEAYRSCDMLVWQEEFRFWLFEGLAAAIGVIAGLSTALRYQKLRSQGRLNPYLLPKTSV